MRLILERKKLESLTTKRLLSYRKSLLSVPEREPDWETTVGGIRIGGIIRITKESKDWKDCYSLVKQVLSKREHCPRA